MTFVRDDGTGPPVLLLHSLFFDSSMFDSLALPGHRLLRPDHRGQGRSPSGGLPLSMDQLADDAVEVIAGLGPVHLVGSSMGAYVAMRMLVDRPDLVASCTLLGCTADAETDRPRFDRLVAALRNEGPARLVDVIEHTMFGDSHLSRPLGDGVRARWRGHFAGLEPTVADAAQGVFSRDEISSRLDEVTIPLLLIAGDQDHAKRPADLQAIAELVPGSHLVVLAGAGHTPVVEQPERVSSELLRWWAIAPVSASSMSRKDSNAYSSRH